MMGGITIAPVMPWWALIVAIAVIVAMGVVFALRDRRALVWRMAGLILVLLALINPRVEKDKRVARPDVAVVILDQSLSQKEASRLSGATAAFERVVQRLESEPNMEVRTVRVLSDGDGTKVLGSLARAISLMPKGRFAGAVVITDGQVHDAKAWRGAVDAPVHVVLNGARDERDRRVEIVEAPAYAITGKPLAVSFIVQDPGGRDTRPVPVSVQVDGVALDGAPDAVRPGEKAVVTVVPDRAGMVSVEVTVAAVAGEVSTANNKAIATVNAVRDRMKVLLISGQPHPGERTWRNLLKADPSVDLVHFTILRPPEKDDFTPLSELSLIVFPTQELFERRLKEFDLVVFDRYLVRDLLPPSYYENINAFVRGGGAVLMAAGPEFAGARSLARTSLRGVLPVSPTGTVSEREFRPAITALGRRHPVTQGLDDGDNGPAWGRWFRWVDTQLNSGDGRAPQVVMAGPDDAPVLVLDRVGKGRVGVLTSDHVWLWARGYDGGGPHQELLRRLAHWLMKEPALEEDALRASVQGEALTIERRALDKATGVVTVTRPDGSARDVELVPSGDGRASITIDAPAMGLYSARMAGLSARAVKGQANPMEVRDLRASDAVMAPIAKASGGGVFWAGARAERLPDIRRVGAGREAAGHFSNGTAWMGFKRNEAFAVTGLTDTPLVPLPILLALAGMAFVAAWWREGR